MECFILVNIHALFFCLSGRCEAASGDAAAGSHGPRPRERPMAVGRRAHFSRRRVCRSGQDGRLRVLNRQTCLSRLHPQLQQRRQVNHASGHVRLGQVRVKLNETCWRPLRTELIITPPLSTDLGNMSLRLGDSGSQLWLSLQLLFSRLSTFPGRRRRQQNTSFRETTRFPLLTTFNCAAPGFFFLDLKEHELYVCT